MLISDCLRTQAEVPLPQRHIFEGLSAVRGVQDSDGRKCHCTLSAMGTMLFEDMCNQKSKQDEVIWLFFVGSSDVGLSNAMVQTKWC
ncbi:hypothetical protein HYALB_00008639 [Hymenoscyphus albidus]|uniref:Uncharacterized protein n=1 Tax=Hymenoscyphus albidus TaxID=595503 RepID=A0A9N9LCJ3_9HELO|nr:hypothetical protein HYALB_00008639 [Hymenoscyphus albidus]